jgi:hypothetical protein
LKFQFVLNPAIEDFMTFRDVTRTVVDHVEKVSGCPVVVSEDAALKTLAASRIARGENRIHAISFNPSVVREPAYLICYRSGFIPRLFAIPAAERVDLASTAEGRQLVAENLQSSCRVDLNFSVPWSFRPLCAR